MTKWLKDDGRTLHSLAKAMACAVSGKDYRSLRCLFNWIVFNLIASEQVVAFYMARPSLSDYLAHSTSPSISLSLRACLGVCLSCLVLDRFWLCFVCVFSPTLIVVVVVVSCAFYFFLGCLNTCSTKFNKQRTCLVSSSFRPSCSDLSSAFSTSSCAQSSACIACKTSISWSSRLIKLVFPAPSSTARSLLFVDFKAKKHVLSLLIFHTHSRAHTYLYIPLAFFIQFQIEPKLYRLTQSFSFVVKSAIAPRETQTIFLATQNLSANSSAQFRIYGLTICYRRILVFDFHMPDLCEAYIAVPVVFRRNMRKCVCVCGVKWEFLNWNSNLSVEI